MAMWLVQRVDLNLQEVQDRFIDAPCNASEALALFLDIPKEDNKEFFAKYRLTINEFKDGPGGFKVFIGDELFIVTKVD